MRKYHKRSVCLRQLKFVLIPTRRVGKASQLALRATRDQFELLHLVVMVVIYSLDQMIKLQRSDQLTYKTPSVHDTLTILDLEFAESKVCLLFDWPHKLCTQCKVES